MFADNLALTEESEMEVMGGVWEIESGIGIKRIKSQYGENKVKVKNRDT